MRIELRKVRSIVQTFCLEHHVQILEAPERLVKFFFLKQCSVAEVVCEVQIAHVSSVKALQSIGRENFVVTAVCRVIASFARNV